MRYCVRSVELLQNENQHGIVKYAVCKNCFLDQVVYLLHNAEMQEWHNNHGSFADCVEILIVRICKVKLKSLVSVFDTFAISTGTMLLMKMSLDGRQVKYHYCILLEYA